MPPLSAVAMTTSLTLFVLLQMLSYTTCRPGQEVSVVKRQVKAPGTYFLDTPLEVKATPGSDVILPCSLQNVGVKTVEWRRTSNYDPITVGLMMLAEENGHYDLRWNSLNSYEDWHLQINGVKITDAGSYTCDILGTAMLRNITLVVQDGPPVTQHAPSNGKDNDKVGSPKCFDEYSCGDGKCVYLDWCCDGLRDCINGADEDKC